MPLRLSLVTLALSLTAACRLPSTAKTAADGSGPVEAANEAALDLAGYVTVAPKAPAKCVDEATLAKIKRGKGMEKALGQQLVRCFGADKAAQLRVAELFAENWALDAAGDLLQRLYHETTPPAPGAARARGLRSDIVHVHATVLDEQGRGAESRDVLRRFITTERFEVGHMRLLLEQTLAAGGPAAARAECDAMRDTEHGVDCVQLLEAIPGAAPAPAVNDAIVASSFWRRPLISYHDFRATIAARPGLLARMDRYTACTQRGECGPSACPWDLNAPSGNIGDTGLYYALARATDAPPELRACAARTAASFCVGTMLANDTCVVPGAITLFFREHLADGAEIAGRGHDLDTLAQATDDITELKKRALGRNRAFYCNANQEALFAIHFALAATYAHRPELAKPSSSYLNKEFQTCRMRLLYQHIHGSDMPCDEHPAGTEAVECAGDLAELPNCGSRRRTIPPRCSNIQ